jgi:hypothetical protein
MRGGQEPVRVDVETGGVHLLELNVDDAGDGPACDHADWADAQLRLADGTTLWLDKLPRTTGAQVRLGSRHYSSNHHLPFFNVESSEARGVLVGLGWTGNWDAEIGRRGTRLSTRAGLPTTRFFLRPGCCSCFGGASDCTDTTCSGRSSIGTTCRSCAAISIR